MLVVRLQSSYCQAERLITLVKLLSGRKAFTMLNPFEQASKQLKRMDNFEILLSINPIRFTITGTYLIQRPCLTQSKDVQ